jgi:FtsH-binding integral membrane protein
MKRPALFNVGIVLIAIASLIECASRDWRAPNHLTEAMMLAGAVLMLLGRCWGKSAPQPSKPPIRTLVYVLAALPAFIIVPILAYYRGGLALRVVVPAMAFSVVGFSLICVYLRRQGKLR